MVGRADQGLGSREGDEGLPGGRVEVVGADPTAQPVKVGSAESLLGEWEKPYSRGIAAFPVESLRTQKYWPPVGRADNVYGDRNLFCACVPMSEYVEE